ncbi:methylated-DNA--[protein]-cysteine S-methyltransferase [Pontibacter lucknowensis]|nr:methylated-DNA--[protein]-cysteine S-methyltransferase [Pontibacter lucknowensis]
MTANSLMQEITYTTYIKSPLGLLRISGTEQGISEIRFEEEEAIPALPESSIPTCLQACAQQLEEYFAGERQDFDLVLAPAGTAFQKQVWQELQGIPHGKTTSYLAVSRAVSGEKAIRAVGAANGRNPICIAVPCHRVIGSDGSLTGYAGGLWRKEWLLRHEGALRTATQIPLF